MGRGDLNISCPVCRQLLLLLKHIFQPDLRERLPEVVAPWYILRQQPHALGYLEAVIRT